jgi:hypothetical protein
MSTEVGSGATRMQQINNHRTFTLVSSSPLPLRILLLILSLSLLVLILLVAPIQRLPFTGFPPLDEITFLDQTDDSIPTLDSFRAQVQPGRSTQVVGVWAEGLFAFHVEPTPGQSVPQLENTAGIYEWAVKRGTTALMIHNYLGGDHLYQVKGTTAIALIFGDGRVEWYQVDTIERYEAMNFSQDGFEGPFKIWDCESCDFEYSVSDLQRKHYTGSNSLAFQTCLDEDNKIGFLIIEASPITH